MNGQLSDLKKKMLDEINKNSSNSLKNFEENLKRLESNEKNHHKQFEEIKDLKIGFEEKLFEMQNKLKDEINGIKKELTDHSILLENIETKVNDSILSMNRDIGELLKGVNFLKLEMESVKNFKENTVLNFKDIGDEFLKNEEKNKKFTYRINQQLMDFDNKIAIFEQNFALFNDNFVNIKKDIYAQIYDSNMKINNKLQLFNENMNQKYEAYDKVIYDFENNLMVIN